MLDLIEMKQRRRMKIVNGLQKALSDLLRERDLLYSAGGNFLVITRVDVSDDYGHARVYCSCFGDKQQQRIDQLQHHAKDIRVWLTAKRMFRRCPELSFHLDTNQIKVHSLLTSFAKD